MANNEVWGIDIGKAGLKAVKMRRNKDQVEIVAIDIIEYEQPSEAENVDKEEQIRQALIKFKSNNKIKNEKIFVSIPGQATFNRLITIPPVEAKRIREIVSYEAKQQIPFPLTDVLWDYQVIGSLKEKTTEEREVMLFAVRKEIINNFLANLAAADIRIQGIQIASVAIYNFIRYEKKDLDACVAIDIGAENTDLIVVDNDKLWLRALPFAGNDITKALQKRFNIPYDEAEKLKLKSGKTKQSKKIFEVMKPVLKDIVGEIHRSVGYFKSMSKDVKFEKMIFLGNATKLSGFQEFFSQNLQYDIEILSEINNIHVSPKLNLNLFQSNLTTFAVAIGLALQGVGVSVNNICLLPEEIAIKSLVQNQKKYLGLAVLLLGLVPLILWGTTNQNLTKLQITNQTIDKKLKPINSKVETLNKVKNYQEIQSQLQKFLEVGKDRKVFREILNSFHETLLEASKEIKDNELDEHKFWLLDLSIVKNSELPGTEQITAFYDPILTKVEVAFLSLGDPVEDFEHVGKYFVKKLEDDKHQYKNQKLFNPFGKRSGEAKSYLFLGDESSDNSYYHISVTFETLFGHKYLGDASHSLLKGLNDQEILNSEFKNFLVSKELASSELTFDSISVDTLVQDNVWRVQTQVESTSTKYLVVKTKTNQEKNSGSDKNNSENILLRVYSIIEP